MEQAGIGDTLPAYDKMYVWTALGAFFEYLGAHRKCPVISAHEHHVTTVAPREQMPGYSTFHLQGLKYQPIVSNVNGCRQKARSAFKMRKNDKIGQFFSLNPASDCASL